MEKLELEFRYFVSYIDIAGSEKTITGEWTPDFQVASLDGYDVLESLEGCQMHGDGDYAVSETGSARVEARAARRK